MSVTVHPGIPACLRLRHMSLLKIAGSLYAEHAEQPPS